MKKNNIIIDGYQGSWSICDKATHNNRKYYELENDILDYTIIVDEDMNILVEDYLDGIVSFIYELNEIGY